MILSILLLAFPQQQVDSLVQSDPDTFDNFGNAVAIDGDVAVVGASTKSYAGLNYAGAVYVYRRIGGVWSEEAKLTVPVPEIHDNFGTAVAIDGDVIVVGAPDFPVSSFNGTGRAWVFRRIAGTWTMEQELVPSMASGDGASGRAVAIDGNTIVVTTASWPLFSPRIAVIFEHNGSSWVQTDSISTPVGMSFASEVRLHGDRLAIDSPDESENGIPEVGAVYLYERQGGVWNQVRRFSSPFPSDGEWFGSGFDFEDDLFVAGAANASFQGQVGAGVLYAFRESGGVWQLEAEIEASLPTGGAGLGSVVAVDAGNILSSSGTPSSGSPFLSGAGHLYRQGSPGQWEGGTAIYPVPGVQWMGFGSASALSGDTALFSSFPGEVQVFSLTGGFRLHGPAPFSQLKADDFNTLRITGGAAQQPTWLAMSLVGFGAFPVVPLGVTVDLASPSPLGGVVNTDSSGRADWTFFVPSSAEDRSAWWQSVQGGQTSNAVGTFVK